MPRLPSGREVALQAARVASLAQQYERTGEPAAFADVRTVQDLFPYIDVIFFRPSNGKRQTTDSAIPPGLEPYESGYTLADVETMVQQWSEEDRTALQAFLGERRTHEHLANALKRARLAQLARAEPTTLAVLQAITLTNPELLDLDEP